MPRASQAKRDEIIVNENFDVGKRRGFTFDHVSDIFEYRAFGVYNISTSVRAVWKALPQDINDSKLLARICV